VLFHPPKDMACDNSPFTASGLRGQGQMFGDVGISGAGFRIQDLGF
jgi:hypothetical protein